MGKAGTTILGLAVLVGAAIFVGRSYLMPGGEGGERDDSVLTGALDPRVDSVELLEDADLPEGVEPPKVGDLARYVRVTILYPGQPRAPEPEEHKLTQVNAGDFDADPVHGETLVEAEGARVVLIYRTSADFEWGRIELGEKVIAERFQLE